MWKALILQHLWNGMCWIYITFTTVLEKSLNMPEFIYMKEV